MNLDWKFNQSGNTHLPLEEGVSGELLLGVVHGVNKIKRSNKRLKIFRIDPLTDKRWDDYVHMYSKGSAYHHSAWIDQVYASDPYRPHCYVLLGKGTNLLAGVLPFMVSSRWLKRRRGNSGVGNWGGK